MEKQTGCNQPLNNSRSCAQCRKLMFSDIPEFDFECSYTNELFTTEDLPQDYTSCGNEFDRDTGKEEYPPMN